MGIKEFEKDGQKQVFKPAFRSIAELLEHHKKKFGEKDAILTIDVDSGKEQRLSYAQLAEAVYKTAQFLLQKGVKKGDRVAFAFENTATILILEFAAALLGASSLPIDIKRDVPERIQFKLKDARVKLFFKNEKEVSYQNFTQIPLHLPKANSLTDEYLLLYTSGTTAHPKGVPLSLLNIMANAQGIIDWQKLSAEDRFLILLPLHHINSTTMSFAMLLAGGTVLLLSRYSASKFWELSSKYKATITSIVPTILHDLLSRKGEYFAKNYKLSFKRILIGSAPVLPEETLRFIETFGLDVVQGYGQTETALRVTGLPIDLERQKYLELTKKNSIGKELAYCNVAILRQDGKESKESQEGEICIRGPVLGNGYLNSPEETKKSFFGGWFHSGDLGFYEIIEGEKYFFIKGRLKEIIIKGGVNISPAAVEDSILKNFPEIEEICVVGYPDSRMGEELAAVISLRDKEKGDKIAKRLISESLAGKLAGLSKYEAPSRVFLLNEGLPKTSTGKIQRVKVKEMVAERIAKEKAEHLYCRLIDRKEQAVIAKAVEINNKRWCAASSQQEFEQRAANGYLIGVFDEEENLLGTLSALQITATELEAAKTWAKATSQGTLKNHNPKGEIMLCVAITVKGQESEKALVLREVPQQLADATIKDYLKTDLDNVIRFHRKPKGGMAKGAKVIGILSQGRPEDKDAMGYNVLLEYPQITKDSKIVKTKNARPSVLLIEQALILAKEKGCSRVIAFSHPAQFRLHLACAIDSSLPFQPKDEKAFNEFSKIALAILYPSNTSI